MVPLLTKPHEVKIKSQTLNSRIEKPMSARCCDNATVILGIFILILLMMKMR